MTSSRSSGCAAGRAEQAARDAIVDTPLSDWVRAVLIGAAIEIHVPQSAHDDQVRASPSQYAWTWKLTS